MNKNTNLLFFAALTLLVVTTAFTAGVYTERRQAVQYPLLLAVRRLLGEHYIRPLPDERQMEYGAIHGLLGVIGDPYTRFVEPQPHELEVQSLAGEYGGIGVELRRTDDGRITLYPYRDSPAQKAGIIEGDVLLQVEATAILTTTTLDEAVGLIRGEVGTFVTLQLRHPTGELVTVRLRRERLELPSTRWEIISHHPQVGLISINRFSDKTPDEIRRAGEELRAQGATCLILDLRNNGGGILDSGVKVAALFLDGGVVMYETQKNAPDRVFNAPGKGPLADIPLAVLVNHNTASAAEIVAGALLDRHRAPLIGQTTYGKGSVQLMYELEDQSSLHLTAYLWYTPSRRELDHKGLPPTIAVEPSADGSDAELEQAIRYLEALP